MHDRRLTMKVASLKQLKDFYFKRLNDIYIASQLTRFALAAYMADIAAGGTKSRYRYFEVPSGGKPTARIRREKADVALILSASRDEGELQKSLVLAVAVTEDFLMNAMRMVLRAYPERLLRGIKGGDAKISIDFESFLTKDRSDILEEQIASRLQDSFYASPSTYLQFLAQTLEIALPEDAFSSFVEIKASRDVVVHGNGVADPVYARKAADRARAAAGHLLPIDQAYFDGAIAALKTLIGLVGDALAVRYRTDERVKAQAIRLFQQ